MRFDLGLISKFFVVFLYASISLLLGLLFGLLSVSEKSDKLNCPEELIYATRYISPYGAPNENMTTSNLLGKDSGTYLGGELNIAKQGVLQEDSNRNVIKFKSDLTEEQKDVLESEYGVSFTDDVAKNGVYVVNSDENSNIESLKSSDLVALIEVDKPVSLLSQKVDWGIERIGAGKTWDETSGDNVIVAVIDTGVQIDHEDLGRNISDGFDFVNNNTVAYDDNGHGTHVAGIIAAHNNTVGIVGGSYNTQIMPIKVLNAQGYGYLSDVAKGIYYAADNDARIINLSLGTNYDSSILRDAIGYAARKGVLIVGAAGNSSSSSCAYPAGYPEVICVVATDQDNKLAGFSNQGGELSAPGVSNYSTYIGNRYAYLSGTSMAAPHVSASASLVYSFCPLCTASEVRNILRETAVDLGTVGTDSIFGYGLVDVFAAIDSLQDDEIQEDNVEQEDEEESHISASIEEVPTPSVEKSKPVIQKLSILEPELNTSRRIILSDKSDIKIAFEVRPQTENSALDKIVLLIDNEEVFTTDEQIDEYIWNRENLTNNQYFIRIIAYFKDRGIDSQNFIVDLTKTPAVERNSRANPNLPANRKVLGASTEFLY